MLCKHWPQITHRALNFVIPCVISDFRCEENEILVLLGYYTAYNGNSLPTFRDNQSHIQRSRIPSSRVHNPVLDPWRWDPTSCPDTSVKYYRSTLRKSQKSVDVIMFLFQEKVRRKFKVTPVHNMKAYGENRVQFDSYLTLALRKFSQHWINVTSFFEKQPPAPDERDSVRAPEYSSILTRRRKTLASGGNRTLSTL